MNNKQTGKIVGIIAGLLTGLGLVMPIYTLNLGLLSTTMTFFDAEPRTIETFFFIVGIAAILIGAFMEAMPLTAVGGLVSLAMSVDIIVSANNAEGLVKPTYGFFIHLIGGIAALVAAYLLGTSSGDTSQHE